MDTSIDSDKALIERLGGSTKVACLLGFKKDGGVQRVENWKKRGIPSHIKVRRPDLFMADEQSQTARTATETVAGVV
ncbi:hypothetical protein [Acidovorax sp.]|uniref:hypothetical protein n=1 Tax=Acidovorax sp. TaxID=1872122 RepID=UPI0025C6E370|nr:hypothetical protein [Acidovorax sp.]MBL7091337.1 hypothetical protein [Acidovorax sp.]